MSLIFRAWCSYLVYVFIIYMVGVHYGWRHVLYDEGRSIKFLGNFVSFLLVWRLNQCYIRYEAGKEQTSALFSALHSIAGVACAYLRGADEGALHTIGEANNGEDSPETLNNLAAAVRINVVRFCLAIGISFKYHCRIAESAYTGEDLSQDQLPGLLFDLARLKGLLYPQECSVIDLACGLNVHQPVQPSLRRRFSSTTTNASQQSTGVSLKRLDTVRRSILDASTLQEGPVLEENNNAPCALLVLLIQLLRDTVMQPMNQKWGYPERIVNILELYLKEISMTFEQLDRLITIPLPLAYLQHCKLLFLAFIFTYPLTICAEDGVWANVFSPSLLFGALLGFEVLADEMENPIGDDVLDLNTMRMIHELETRLVEIFSVTESKRGALRDAMCTPLGDMQLPNLDRCSSNKPMPAGREFYSHFAWVPLPAHVIAYCGEKEHGNGAAMLRRANLRPAEFDRCCCRKVIPLASLDDREQSLREEAVGYNLVTSFLCLRTQKMELDATCRLHLLRFLGIEDDSASSVCVPVKAMPTLNSNDSA